MDDIDQQSKDGFDWIDRNVTFKVRKARFAHFPIIINTMQQ